MSGSAFDDSELDAKLRQVSLPPGFVARLKQIGDLSDDELDRTLRDIPLPPGLLHRLRGIARHSAPWLPSPRFMLAASVLIAVGLAYFASIAAFLFTGPKDHAPAPADVAQVVPRNVVPIGPPSHVDGKIVPDPRQPKSIEPKPADAIVHQPGSDTDWEAIHKAVESIRPVTAPADKPGLDSGVFASPLDKLPELSVAPGIRPRGIAPPRVKGYDLLFQLNHGVHPVVSPAANPALKICEVPLVTDTASFELLRRAIGRGQLPPPQAIRVEEFLAALDYDFSLPAAGQLGLRTAAGPAPFGASGDSLLQIGVQTGPLSAAPAGPSRLVVALDVSASMGRQGRFDAARRAILEFARHLSSSDRLTVVLFNERATLSASVTGPENLQRLQTALMEVTPAGSANVGEALQLAAATLTADDSTAANNTAANTTAEVRKRLVLITDGLAELDSPTVQRIEGLLGEASNRGVKLEVFDLGADETDVDSQLTRFAQVGGGSVAKFNSADSLRAALTEVATGQSQVVASSAKLKLTFNPNAVANYRLLGHEASSGGALLSAPVECDLLAGQTATALFEVSLLPEGESQVAVAEVTWYEPGSSKPRRLTQPISRLQFAQTFSESPLSLQSAAIAAEAAEVLRGSYFAPSSGHSLRRARELAGQVNTRLQDNASFRDLVDLLDRAGHLTSPGVRSH